MSQDRRIGLHAFRKSLESNGAIFARFTRKGAEKRCSVLLWEQDVAGSNPVSPTTFPPFFTYPTFGGLQPVYTRQHRPRDSDAPDRRCGMTPVANTRSDSVGWRDIETAPRDGAWIIVFNGEEVCPATWVDDSGYFGSGDVGWCYGDAHWGGVLHEGINLMQNQPSHWQPLPTPPALEERRG